MNTDVKIGLALGSGSSRDWSHIGNTYINPFKRQLTQIQYHLYNYCYYYLPPCNNNNDCCNKHNQYYASLKYLHVKTYLVTF